MLLFVFPQLFKIEFVACLRAESIYFLFSFARILDFVDEQVQGDLLASVSAIAREEDFDAAKHFDVFACELCLFKSTDPEEMKLHCVGHYYQVGVFIIFYLT